MATPAENLATRRAAVCTELAAMTSTSNGGRPSYSIDGQSVDHVAYKKSLYDELASIDAALASIDGPIECVTEGLT